MITEIGKRDGSTIKVETVLEVVGDKKDYILCKTGQHKVTLFRVIKAEHQVEEW